MSRVPRFFYVAFVYKKDYSYNVYEDEDGNLHTNRKHLIATLKAFHEDIDVSEIKIQRYELKRVKP